MMIAAAALVAMVAAGAALHGQVFRARSEGVRISVLVTDRGRPVPQLEARHFEVRDRGVLQQVEVVPVSAAIAVTLVLDVSASMAGKPLADLMSAADAVLTQLRAGDRAALIAFAQRIDLLSPPTTGFDRVRQQLREIRAGGATALADAAAVALALASRDSDPGLLIVFSDGADNSSWLSESSVVAAAQRSESVVYAITTRGRRSTRRNDSRLLHHLSAATGGTVEYAGSTADLANVFLRVLQQFRHRYVLTYTPSGVGDDAGWHEVEVRLKGRTGRVTARRGYWAGHDRTR